MSAAAPARLLLGSNGHILIADYDGANNSLNITLNETVTGTPSWMAFASPDRLFAVDELSNTLRLFKLDLETNKLDLQAEKNGSAGVVHLEFNHDKTRMVGAAYGNGTVDVWNTETLELIKTIKSEGNLGPNTERQDAAHPHQANLDPSGRYFAVNDLGTDSVLVIDSKDDAFEVVTRVQLSPGGCGPRHGVFFPRGNNAKATHYMVACEMTNVVQVFALEYATQGGIKFTLTQTISTFGPYAAAPEGAAVGEMVLAPNNEDLYVSNRLTGDEEDNVAHFKIVNGATTLRFVDTVPSGGVGPRMMSLADDGSVLFAANQVKGRDALVALKRKCDGSLEEKPLASLDMGVFGSEEGAGPQFVQQIA